MLHNFLSTYSPWLDVLTHWNVNIPLSLRLNVREKNDHTEIKGHRVNDKVLLTYLILMWTILYSLYKLCLKVYLRNLGFALLCRDRIASVLWNCGLTSIIVLYTVFLWDLLFKPEQTVVVLKSFYMHCSGIMIISNNSWLKGFSNFLFVLFVFGISRQSLQPPVTSIFLLKCIDTFVLDVCRLLYLKWPVKVKQIYAKILYMLYCVFWTYLYMVYVPSNLLMPYKYQSLHEKLLLWLWFITQYLDFVWLNLIRNFKSPKLLELCLFSDVSAESIHLTKIFNSNKKVEKSKKPNETVAVKRELWQTLFCAMAMKKKIKRLRRSKLANKESLSEQENVATENETDNQ